MSKDTYYFSHDSNARNDPKILDMISNYGIISYAWYWVLVEMMREQKDFKLKLCKCNAFAMPLQCDQETVEKFVYDCINEFELFDSDEEFFWSNSLIYRMKKVVEKSEKARKSALKRWDNANAMPTQCEGNAINESKVKEIKLKEKIIGRFTTPTHTEVMEYCQQRNNNVDAEKFIDFYESKGWMVGKNKMKDWKAAVRTWEKESKPKQDSGGYFMQKAMEGRKNE